MRRASAASPPPAPPNRDAAWRLRLAPALSTSPDRSPGPAAGRALGEEHGIADPRLRTRGRGSGGRVTRGERLGRRQVVSGRLGPRTKEASGRLRTRPSPCGGRWGSSGSRGSGRVAEPGGRRRVGQTARRHLGWGRLRLVPPSIPAEGSWQASPAGQEVGSGLGQSASRRKQTAAVRGVGPPALGPVGGRSSGRSLLMTQPLGVRGRRPPPRGRPQGGDRLEAGRRRPASIGGSAAPGLRPRRGRGRRARGAEAAGGGGWVATRHGQGASARRGGDVGDPGPWEPRRSSGEGPGCAPGSRVDRNSLAPTDRWEAVAGQTRATRGGRCERSGPHGLEAPTSRW